MIPTDSFWCNLIFLACCAFTIAPNIPSSYVQVEDVVGTGKNETFYITVESSEERLEDKGSADDGAGRGVPGSFDFPTHHDRLLILDVLNNPQFSLRAHAIGAPVYGMRCVAYDESLEKSAYMTASKCTGMHSTNTQKPSEYADVLEAITIIPTPAPTAQQPTFSDALNKIYQEGQQAHYDPITGTCALDCHNYKSMMYKDNDAVGCAMIRCSQIDSIGGQSGYVTVCLFGSATPFDYNRRAYDTGQTCMPQLCPPEKPICDTAGLCCYNRAANGTVTANGQVLLNTQSDSGTNQNQLPSTNPLPQSPISTTTGTTGGLSTAGTFLNNPGFSTQFPNNAGLSTQFPNTGFISNTGFGPGQVPNAGLLTGTSTLTGLSGNPYPNTGIVSGLYPNLYPNSGLYSYQFSTPGVYTNQFSTTTYPNQFLTGGTYPNLYQSSTMYQNPYQASTMYPNPYQTSTMYQNPYQTSTMYPNPYQASTMYQTSTSYLNPYQMGTSYPNPYQMSTAYQNPYQVGISYPSSYLTGTSYTPNPYQPGMSYSQMYPSAYQSTVQYPYQDTSMGMYQNQYGYGISPFYSSYPTYGTTGASPFATQYPQYPQYSQYSQYSQYPQYSQYSQYPQYSQYQYPYYGQGSSYIQYPSYMSYSQYPYTQQYGQSPYLYTSQFPYMYYNQYQSQYPYSVMYPYQQYSSPALVPYPAMMQYPTMSPVPFPFMGGSSSASTFYYNGNQLVARCPPGQFTFYRHTWNIGGTRNYYVPRGWRPNLDACMADCAMMDDCYFATLTGSGNCYLLTTSSPATCRYLTGLHFGPIGERCTFLRPCPSAYKICTYPRCSLISLIESYCRRADPNTAMSRCRPGFCTSGFCVANTGV